MRIADIIVNAGVPGLAKEYSYILPDELSAAGRGWRVAVPFGARTAEGFIMSVREGDGTGLKSVLSMLDTEAWFDESMIALANWLSDYYLCSPADALRLFIPGKTGVRSLVLYHRLLPQSGMNSQAWLASKSPLIQDVYRVLPDNPGMPGRDLLKQFGPGVVSALTGLTSAGLAARTVQTRRRITPKIETEVSLAIDTDAAQATLEILKNKPAQQRFLRALIASGTLSSHRMREMGLSRDAGQRLAAAGLVVFGTRQVWRNSYSIADCKAVNALPPTPAQAAAMGSVERALAEGRHEAFLLYGVTASGKTEVYLAAAAAARSRGRGVIVLVPEIALTHQIVARFQARFGEDVAVVHSRLSVAERCDVWDRLRSGDVGIVIGARSAVFAPVQDLGLIILDEEHEFSYKQEDSPRYHARTVAAERARISSAALLLGSATPAVETFAAAQAEEITLLELPERIDARPMPLVELVDMRQELAAGRRNVISPALRDLLAETLAAGQQAIVLLNRRGYSTFVLCRDCGHVLRCPHCAVSLVYHASGGRLKCHYCGEASPCPDTCPKCGGRKIRYFGSGTQKVEEELAALFPAARTVRMDQDTTGGKFGHEQILKDFAVGKYNILLGTQMVAKGHDLPGVTAVGVVSADTALNLPDFRAGERTFSILTQAAGRAGRGELPGRVVVQTYNPDHYAVQAAATQDYRRFYNEEAEFRRALKYPPFAALIKITVQGAKEEQAAQAAHDCAAALRQQLTKVTGTEVIGPFPAPITQIKDIFRMHILLKGPVRKILTDAIRNSGCHGRSEVLIDVDPLQVL